MEHPFAATSWRLIRLWKEVTSEMCTPSWYCPSPKGSRERPSSISTALAGSMVKTMLVNSRWFLIGRYYS